MTGGHCHTPYARPSQATILLAHLEDLLNEHFSNWLSFLGAEWKKQLLKCSLSKSSRWKLRRTGPLQPVIAGAAYERWYNDLTGPHPRSERGHILTCLNAFTKWAEAFPLRSKEAEPIAKVLVEQVFCHFVSPVSLLSDQGKEVDGNVMKHVCRMLGIDKLRTTPYKPLTNQVERLHQRNPRKDRSEQPERLGHSP